MNDFTRKAVQNSGKTAADIARNMKVTPQAAGKIILAEHPPKLNTLVKFLRACGWSDEQIADLRIGEILPLESKEPA